MLGRMLPITPTGLDASMQQCIAGCVSRVQATCMHALNQTLLFSRKGANPLFRATCLSSRFCATRWQLQAGSSEPCAAPWSLDCAVCTMHCTRCGGGGHILSLTCRPCCVPVGQLQGSDDHNVHARGGVSIGTTAGNGPAHQTNP